HGSMLYTPIGRMQVSPSNASSHAEHSLRLEHRLLTAVDARDVAVAPFTGAWIAADGGALDTKKSPGSHPGIFFIGRRDREGRRTAATRSADAAGGGLGAQAELGGLEGVPLGHGLLGAVEAIEDQLAEELEADLAGHFEVMLAFVVHQIDVVAGLLPADIDILAQLDVALGAENRHAAVAPGAQPGRRQPVHADVVAGAVVADEVGLAEILQLGVFRAVEVGRGGIGHGRVGRAGEGQELLELMAADVAEDAAVLLLLEKPVG